MRHLAEAWLRTTGRAGARGDVAAAGADLLGRYAEPHRRYHDLGHLDEVLRHVDELAGYAADPDTVRLAAWFHDAVYDVHSTGSEERSARLAETTLGGLGVATSVVLEVARLVRLTARHDAAADDRNGAVLCDADLAVLAGDPAAYAAYVARVRAEYAHVDDADFARGRGAVLAALLARDPLYATPEGRRDWEPRARDNLAAELWALRDGSAG
jgi:predicted metal-dependent HD superfamily phosphohydrolase